MVDGRQQLYDKIVSYIIKANILRGGVYPLSAGPERIIQAAVVKIAKKIGASAIAHGSTGAGNDQVRFDTVIKVLASEMEILTPIRELGISEKKRSAFGETRFYCRNYLENYSVNKGMLGTTIGEETKILELPPDSVYPSVVGIDNAPKGGKEIIISFKKGTS